MNIRNIFTSSRIQLLKMLDSRPYTVSELAKLTGYSKSSILYHLEKLSKAGMVERIENERKWIYYQLTDKGRRAIRYDAVAKVMLAIGSVTFISSIGMIITKLIARLEEKPLPEAVRAPEKAPITPVKPEFEVVRPVIEPAYVLLVLGAILIILFIYFRRKW
jgi:DNA-binding transcriptional ArsR family regulator